MISTAPRIMNKFVLKIKAPEVLTGDRVYKELMSLQRHFTKADIEVKNAAEESKLMQVIERFGKRLRDVKLKHYNWPVATTAKVLEKMPELEELEIDFITGILSSKSEVGDVSSGTVFLKKLKKLTVGEDWGVFALIKAPMLLKLRVEGDSRKDHIPPNFEDFLRNSPKIESLHIEGEKFPEEIGSIFPYQLKELELCWFDEITDKIKGFLQSQAPTVEKLRVASNSSVLEIVLPMFKRLTSLEVLGLDASEEFYKHLKPMPLLTDLVSDCGFPSEAALRAFLGNCPELKSLDISDDLVHDHAGFSSDTLEFIAGNNKKLELLNMNSFESSSPCSYKFEHLQALALKTTGNAEFLRGFLEANPTIETLYFFFPDYLSGDYENIADLVGLPNVKRVEIGADCYEPEDLQDIYEHMVKKFTKTSTKVELGITSEYEQAVIITKEAQTKGTKRRRSSSIES